MTTYFTDRSRIIEFRRCPRARFLGYHLLGTGVRKVRATIPLATGAHVHAGLAELLHQLQQGPIMCSVTLLSIDIAVNVALEGYRAELADRGLDIELGEDGAYVAAEQMALIEGILRAYAARGLDELVEKYEVLEVEREDVWHQFNLIGADKIDLQSRADALLRERSTGDLYILSFKTAAGKDWRQDSDNRHDVQGLSEAAVVERRLRQWWDKLHTTKIVTCGFGMSYEMREMLSGMSDPPRIMGIQMVYLYKGRRSQSVDGGPYLTESHLIRGWYKEGVTDRDYAWRYKWDGPDTWPDTGRLRGHTLGKGWTRFDTWAQEGGVKAWLDKLVSGAVQPGIDRNPLDDTYQMPLPIYRQDRDMSDWIEQAQEQERRVIQDMQTLEQVRAVQRDDAAEKFRHVLNALAPQNRRSCDWPSKCQFQEICFGDDSMLTGPCSTGLYQARQPHHAPEAAALAAGKP